MTPQTGNTAYLPVLISTLVAVPIALADQAILSGYYVKLLVLQLGVVALALGLAIAPPPRRISSPLFLPIGVVVACAILTSLWAVNRVEASVQIAQRLTLACFFVLCLQRVTVGHIPVLITAIAAVAGLVSLVGLGQYSGIEALLALPSGGMPSATFGYRNYAAMFLIQAIPFTLYGLIRSHPRQRIVWALNLALLLAYLLATRSRAAWGGLLLAALFAAGYLILSRRRTHPKWTSQLTAILPHTGAAVVAAFVFATAISPDMAGRGYDSHAREKTELAGAVTSLLQRGADKDRITMWKNTLPMVVDHPLGVGPGNWQFQYPAYDKGDVAWKGGTPRRPHNDYLWMIAELGIPGGIAYACVFAVGFILGCRGIRSPDPHTSLIALVASTSLLAIGAQAFFSFPAERIASSTLTWFTLVVLAVCGGTSSHRNESGAIFWFAALATAGAALVSYNAIRFDRANEQAFAHSQMLNWTATEMAASRAIQYGKFDPQIYLLRGVSRHHRRDFAGAVQDQRTCLQYHPHFVNALNNLGMSLNALGQYDEAIAPLQKVRALQPDHFESHVNLATSFRGKRDFTRAVEEYRSAQKLGENNDELRLEIAATLETAGLYEDALEELSLILTNDSANVSAHYRKAVVLQKVGRLNEALTAINTVQALSDIYVPSYYTRGEILVAMGDTSGALAAFEGFLERWKGNAEAAEIVRRQMESLK